MTKKIYALSILLLLILAGAALIVQTAFNGGASVPPAAEEVSVIGGGKAGEAGSGNKSAFDLSPFEARRILAVYFHGTIRCKTCLKIEQIARESVTSGFGDGAGAGGVLWASVDYDIPENDRYIEELQIELPSLIVMEVEDGKMRRWKKLRKTWDLVEDEQALSKYVIDEIFAFVSP